MADSSILDEGRAMGEYMALQIDPVYQGQGVPRGSGQRVLVIPGLLSNDLYLMTIRAWLSRIGYKPVASEVLLNVGCPRRIADAVMEVVESELARDAAPISVIGHSRGGLLGKAIASRLGDKVTNLVLVGSPLGGFLGVGPDGVSAFADFMRGGSDAQEWVVNTGLAATRLFDPDCKSPECGCDYYTDLYAPLSPSTKVTAIYSLEDPIVPAVSAHLPFGNNIALEGGTHSGLMFNREVYPHIAQALAQA